MAGRQEQLSPPRIFRSSFFLWIFLALALLPWLYIRSQQATNPDILWLCEALHRYFSGHRLSEVAYEINPPLSLLIYTLPVLAHSCLNIPLYYATFGQTLILTGLSTLAVYCILSRWGRLQPASVNIVTAALVLADTVCASACFGERDQMIGIALVPFVLMQLTLTFDLPQPKGVKWPVFAIGAIFILVKPHHGLLPTLLLIHRLFLRRNFSVFKDADFLALSIATLSYIVLVLTFFPDYVSVILPDALQLYVPLRHWGLIGKMIIRVLAACGVLSLLLPILPAPRPEKRLAGFLVFAALVSLIPYYVQGMGFYYHLLPALTFLAAAVGLALMLGLKRLTPRMGALPCMMVLTLFAYWFAPLNLDYPRHSDYKNLPLTKILAKECPHDRQCRFFMFNREMGILHETAYYTGAYHASRFPSFWFMPEIVNAQQAQKRHLPSRLSPAATEQYFQKYSLMLAADLDEMKPDVALVWVSKESYLKTDFVSYFSANDAFAHAWKSYKKIRSVKIDYQDYYTAANVKGPPLDYDVYVRVR